MPLWNYAFNQGGPDPDYVYSTTEIDPNGVYRISGYRGTTRFVEITQQGFDMMSPATWSGGATPSRSRTTSTTSQLGDDGYFSVVLSAERPAGHDGDWWELDPRTVPAADAQVLVRLDPRGRRPRGDRAPRRRRRRHVARGDRAPLLRHGGRGSRA